MAARKPGYWVMVEAEERLPVRDYPKDASALSRRQLRGPSVRVSLLQQGVSTSADFDWDYLLAMWPLMKNARADWVTAAARPRAEHDRENYQAMIGGGGPRYLGIGFGEAQTRQSKQCLFGARFQLSVGQRSTTMRPVAPALSAASSASAILSRGNRAAIG